MTTTTFTRKLQRTPQLSLRIEPRIDELEEIEDKICAMLMKTPDCLKESPQPFNDTNPDYINPLKLKDNSSRMKIFQHIEKAELLAEKNSDYIMPPIPVFERISWTLNPQIPIESYKLIPKADLGSHPLVPMENSETNKFLSDLLSLVTFKDKESIGILPPIQEENYTELSLESPVIFENFTLDSLAKTNIGDKKNSKLVEEYCKDKKSVEHSPSANKTYLIDREHSEVKICPHNSTREDEFSDFRQFDFEVIVGKRNKKLEDIPENESERNYLENESCRRIGVAEKNTDIHNEEDEKPNLKFQYANFISENWEEEIPKSGNSIILVCKECGFEEYI